MRRFDAFEFDADRRQLSRGGCDVHLTPKAFDLLGILIEAAPRVVSKTDLHKRLWPSTFVSDATLVGLIKELRRALDDRNAEAPFIRTVQRVGYAFCKATTTSARSPDTVSRWILVGGRRVPLQEGENSIGRDPLSTVWLDVASVSRRHALIVCNGQRAVIEDLGSKNGTTVGEQTVTGARELREGDKLAFGRVDALFCSAASGMPTVTEIGTGARVGVAIPLGSAGGAAAAAVPVANGAHGDPKP
jgi:DNA-binding winged helix-turn-helix (wHTH) protein